MARKKKKKRRLKKGAALVLKWSIAMIIIGTAAFFLMNMVYNRGIYVKTHPLVLDMEEDVSAEDFIETYDDTEVLVTFVDMPVHQIGKQTVEFVVENKKGRSKKYTQTLERVHKDKTAPQINGVHNITVTIGDTVSYLDGVSAVDDVDGPVNVTVEKVSVNTRQTGTYPIAYLATDSAGNLAKVNASVTVVERAQDWQEAYALVDSVLAKITTPQMSLGQKAKAIFDYAHNNITYAGVRLADDWDAEWYAGLQNIEQNGTTGGDCYTYYAVANVLLQRAGAETMRGERQNAGDGSHHYWILCNVGTGWYHFDATQISNGFTCFMLTDKQVRDFTQIKPNFYDFAADRYPATPQTEFVLQ